jgi:hypothetical protein
MSAIRRGAGQSPFRHRGLPLRGEALGESRWQPVLARMFEELRTGSARAQTYWAQQLAFGPVFFHAVVLAVRREAVAADDLEHLRQLLPLALSALGALPDGCAGDPTSLFLLARRQAQALAWGRRRHLARLAARLGLDTSSLPYGPVPRRFQRPYELIGWSPKAATPVWKKPPQTRLSLGNPGLTDEVLADRDEKR